MARRADLNFVRSRSNGAIIGQMRRLMSIKAFALFLAVPVWAQHGGGHGGGGGGHAGGFGGGGFSSGHSSGFSGHSSFGHSGFGHSSIGHSGYGVHAYSGSRSRMSAARPFTRPSSSYSAQRSFSRPPYLHNGAAVNNATAFRNGVGFNSGIGFTSRSSFRSYGYYGFRGFHNCYGWYGCWGWGYPWWGYYDPGFWDSSADNSDDYDQNVADAAEMNRESLEEQQMRQQQEQPDNNQATGQNGPDQDAYARPPLRPRSSFGEDNASPVPATVLVFRDQHKEEVQNYAIVGPTLWNFAPQHTEKIPLTDLDLTATTKANEDRGVTFRIPAPDKPQSPPPANMKGQPAAPANSSSV
jgi:hypothetical protein